MMNRIDIKKRVDEMLGNTLNTLLNGQNVTLICPDSVGAKKQYSLVALVSKMKDADLANQVIYNDDTRIIKIFLKDIEVLRLAGAQIPIDSLKKVKATIKVKDIELSIVGESLQGNERIFVLKCNRLS